MGHHATELTRHDQCTGAPICLGDLHGHVEMVSHGTMEAFARNSDGHKGMLRVGAFPFAPGQPGWIYGISPKRPLVAEGSAPGRGKSLVRLPAPEIYGAAVARAVAKLSDPASELRKVVLARALEYLTDRPVDPLAVAERLGRDAHVTSYALPLPRPEGTPEWLVGATPEVLLEKRGAEVMSHPLAGSARRSADTQDDARIGADLLNSDKDLAEHRHVVEYIHDVLLPFCATLDVPARPSLQRTASMWHLGTEIRGRLRDPETPCLTLLRRLHPTPAVAGAPLAPALELIADCEPEPRGFYAGTLGWLDAEDNGTWYVTLRCAVLDGCRARLHAGAGIVAASTPEAEIAETRAKFTAMRDALGIDTTL